MSGHIGVCAKCFNPILVDKTMWVRACRLVSASNCPLCGHAEVVVKGVLHAPPSVITDIQAARCGVFVEGVGVAPCPFPELMEPDAVKGLGNLIDNPTPYGRLEDAE